jgi:hypothetical protein
MSYGRFSFISPIPPGYSQGNAKQNIFVLLNSDIGFISLVGQNSRGVVDPWVFFLTKSASRLSSSDIM